MLAWLKGAKPTKDYSAEQQTMPARMEKNLSTKLTSAPPVAKKKRQTTAFLYIAKRHQTLSTLYIKTRGNFVFYSISNVYNTQFLLLTSLNILTRPSNIIEEQSKLTIKSIIIMNTINPLKISFYIFEIRKSQVEVKRGFHLFILGKGECKNT